MTGQPPPELLGAVRSYRAVNGWRILEDFAALLALDNQTQDLPALRRNATAIADTLAARGATTEVIEQDGAAPLVVGHLEAGPERPTLGVYVHYDGQPAGSAGWRTPPFDPVLRAPTGGLVPFPRAGAPIDDDWRLFARSAADDKAPHHGFELGKHPQPVLGALAVAVLAGPQPQDVPLPFDRDRRRHVDGPVGDVAVTDLDVIASMNSTG